MNCFFYDVTDVINITNTRARECGFSECVKSTHSRMTPGAIRATTRCTLYTEVHYERG